MKLTKKAKVPEGMGRHWIVNVGLKVRTKKQAAQLKQSLLDLYKQWVCAWTGVYK